MFRLLLVANTRVNKTVLKTMEIFALDNQPFSLVVDEGFARLVPRCGEMAPCVYILFLNEASRSISCLPQN